MGVIRLPERHVWRQSATAVVRDCRLMPPALRSIASPKIRSRFTFIAGSLMFMQVWQRALNSILNALNYDFCPSANSFVYWVKQPVGWVVCAILASTLVGFFIGPQGFVLAAAFVALLFLGVLWPWLCMQCLSCEVKFDQSRSIEGESTKVMLDVVNRMPIPTFGLMVQGKFLRDLIHEDDVIAVSLRRVPGWSVSSFEWSLVPKRRGELPTENPTLVTGFPFGLYQMSKPIQTVGSTIVWPKTSEVDTPVKTVGNQFAIDATASRQAGNDGETIGVRDYRCGDSVRNIHWSHTARHNRLILRERQSLTQTRMRVVLDLNPKHHWGVDSQNTYENAIRLAASVCSELHRHQVQVDLVCVGLATNLNSKSNNRRGIKPLLDFLARLPASDDETSFAVFDESVLLAMIRDKSRFTFIIHTEKFTLGSKDPHVKHFCVESNSEFGLEIDAIPTHHEMSFSEEKRSADSALGAINVPA